MNRSDPDLGAFEQPATPNHAGTGGFNTTHWSAVLQAGDGSSTKSTEALETLCRTYWYPLYAFCRRRGFSPPDGEDLTQQFFAVFIEENSFATASPDRGRFRNFLLASFKNFLANDHHRRMTVKRGGRVAFVSIDDHDLEGHFRREPTDSDTPENLYDRAWALTLLGKVMKDLKDEFTSDGKAAMFETLQVFLTGDKSEVTYEKIGADLGVTESAIKMSVMRLRQRYGQRLREEIAQTLSDLTGVEDELRHLVQALAKS